MPLSEDKLGAHNVPKNIYDMLAAGNGANVLPTAYSYNLGVHYIRGVTEAAQTKVRPPNTIYASEMGMPCLRKLWFKIKAPELAVASNEPTMRLKFMYGDMLEELVLQLASDAGHKVSERQADVEVVLSGLNVRGRIDAVIDGSVVDVKSVTKYSEQKFKDGLKDDPFGYTAQLSFYALGKGFEPKNAGFLTIQKELGHVKYFKLSDMSTKLTIHSLKMRAETIDKALQFGSFEVVPGLYSNYKKHANGNVELCTACSYCEYKRTCYPGMRSFQYSTGVVHFSKIVKPPIVPELS